MGFSSLVPGLMVLDIRPVELLTASLGGAPRSDGAGMILRSWAAALVASVRTLVARTAMNATESSVRIERNLSSKRRVGRILYVSLHLHQELHRLTAIDDSMIIRQRQIHHWPDRRLAVHRDHPVLNLMQPENGHLRRGEDRGAGAGAEDAGGGGWERPA